MNQGTWLQITVLQTKIGILKHIALFEIASLFGVFFVCLFVCFLPCHKWVYGILKENYSGNTFCIDSAVLS